MTSTRALAALAALAASFTGCAYGGRVTGGFLADRDGVSGFITATFAIGTVDHRLGRLTGEVGGTVSDDGDTTHVGVRYQPGRDGVRGWTTAAAVEASRTRVFGQLSGGVSLIHPVLTHETPDVLSGRLFGVDLEAVVAAGGDARSDIHPRIGAQLAFEWIEFALMR